MRKKKKLLLALIRHILTFLGGALVVNDIDSGLVNEAVGGVLTTVGALWSISDKKDSLNDTAGE
jgi:hypothetical protein